MKHHQQPQGICLCSIFLLVTVVCLVSAQGFYSSGGRYGKRDSEDNTNTHLLRGDQIARRSSRLWGSVGSSGDVQQVVPRAERFFMGSRYGKRAELKASVTGEEENDVESKQLLSCRYTGFVNLYRCINSKENSPENEISVQDSSDN